MNIEDLTKDQLKKKLPAFAAGDTVKVHTRITEGDKQRIQVFEGVVLKRSKGKGINGNFTVRKIASGVGVEKTFLLHSPNVFKIEVVHKGVIRRARLYHLRKLKGKTIKIKRQRFGKTKTSQKTAKDEALEQTVEQEEETQEAPTATADGK